MNANVQALIVALVSVASAAVVGLGLADYTNRPASPVVKLDRVVIEGHRSPSAERQLAESKRPAKSI